MRQFARYVAFGYIALIAVVAVLQLVGVTEFRAPFNVIPAPERPPIVVSIIYSSEQREWLTAAQQQFLAQSPTLRGRPIQIQLHERGSLAVITSINQLRPVAIIPTSSTQLNVLASMSSVRAASGINAPQPIALSPLVLVGWKERTDRLFPNGVVDWERLRQALQALNWGDPSLGGQANWGPVKFGHASPRSDTTGVDVLTLLAYAYHQRASGLSQSHVDDNAFQTWFGDIERMVREFPTSSDVLFTNFLQRGPSAYDVVIAYENQAVARANQAPQWGQYQVIYPSASTLSDHPFVILEGGYEITPEQQEAARMFRTFLLGESAQRLALGYGFRPANAAISLNDPDPSNKFPTATQLGVKIDLPGGVEIPNSMVASALLRLWGQQTGR